MEQEFLEHANQTKIDTNETTLCCEAMGQNPTRFKLWQIRGSTLPKLDPSKVDVLMLFHHWQD